jgi:hypothetical protein
MSPFQASVFTTLLSHLWENQPHARSAGCRVI